MADIGKGDWVLICETSERGIVDEVFDKGERFLVAVAATEQWPYPKRLHVMVEKVRKIRPPKVKKKKLFWEQRGLFEE